MIVLDASAVVELLTNGPWADTIHEEIIRAGGSCLAPHLLDIEVTNALRRIAGKSHSVEAKRILESLSALPAARYPHTPLLERVWELRANFTAYDAAYIALAEASNAVLFTCDSKLRKGHRAKVRVFAD